MNSSMSLQMKLGSILIHADELLEAIATDDRSAISFDAVAIRTLLGDPEIVRFLKGIDPALLPVKR